MASFSIEYMLQLNAKKRNAVKTILIRSAFSGIGAATAKHFQANGWNVVATMRTP